MDMPTIHVRPVVRDPQTGLLSQYAAYEGWAPKEKSRSSWWIVALGVALLAFVLRAGL